MIPCASVVPVIGFFFPRGICGSHVAFVGSMWRFLSLCYGFWSYMAFARVTFVVPVSHLLCPCHICWSRVTVVGSHVAFAVPLLRLYYPRDVCRSLVGVSCPCVHCPHVAQDSPPDCWSIPLWGLHRTQLPQTLKRVDDLICGGRRTIPLVLGFRE
jgi:hypothetical protein